MKLNNSDFTFLALVNICILYDFFEGFNYTFDFLALQSIIMYF